VLIFYRVFSRPAGHGYPVGIEWGFFLAFVAAGALTYAGWRMRSVERPEPPARRRQRRAPPREPGRTASPSDAPASTPGTDVTELVGASPQATRQPRASQQPRVPQQPRATPARATRAHSAPVAAEPRAPRTRPRYPPAPPGAPRPPGDAEQLSFEDSPPEGD
jgi:hypothetical protein